MSSKLESEPEVEIGHVLFIDVVGYSKLLTSEQYEIQQLLNETVRQTKAVRIAESIGKLTKLPTGDGMALVFFTTPDAPVRCALELTRALFAHPNLKLRMGIHAGPVSTITDVNDRKNVAGAGINIAQRVMGFGDAGHILVSKRVADDLAQFGQWQSYFHDLGEMEAKHGERIPVVNLYGDGVGNSDPPRQFTQISDRDIRGSVRKVAILPLVNEDSSPEYEYLGDGIAEGIIDILSQSPQLQVIARSTAFRYRESGFDVQELGRRLNVDAIVTGHLKQQQGQLSIKAELIDARNGTQLWGQRFTSGLNNVIAVEASISEQIAGKLRIGFSAEQQNATKTEDTDAYHLYLKGRHHWNKRSERDIRKAIELLRAALDRDPTFARAWAGLADCYTLLGCWGYDAPHDSYPKAKAAAKRAIALDDYLAEAHASLAVTYKDYEWDWAGAEHEYQRALELNPSYALGRQWYGEYLACVGNHLEAITQLEQACELDPLSPMVAATLGRHGYYFGRDFDGAREELRKITRSDPEFWVGHLFLGWVLTMDQQWPEAVEQFTIAQQLDQNAETLVGLGYVLGLSGKVDEARETLAKLKTLRRESYVQPVSIALIHIGLGEKDEAFGCLDDAYEEHAQWLSEIRADPAFDPLRSDDRFTDLLHRIGLAAPVISDV
jgi:TolB-like protein/Tfp pilus assembly protein PilF/class 3 adenylate cyclase